MFSSAYHAFSKFRTRFLAISLSALVVSGCSGADVLNSFATERGVTIERDIRYGSEDRQAYDLYTPAKAAPKATIVFYYGGSWDSGSRDMYRFLGTALARNGFAVAVPDYRLSPQVSFPTFVEDGALALRVVRDKISPDTPLFVMGHSAGAYIAGMIALAPQYLDAQGLSACRDIAGFIGLSGPYDFDITPRYAPTFPPATRDFNQVLPFARDGQHPPSLLIHGLDDTTVEPRDSELLAAALRANGNQVDLELVKGVGHLGIVGAFGRPIRFTAPTLQLVTDFVDRIAAKPVGCRQ